MRPLRTTIAAALAAAVVPWTALTAAAQEGEAELEAELEDAEADLARALEALESAQRELSAIESRIAERAERLGRAERELAAVQEEFAEVEAEADAARAAADEARAVADAAQATADEATEVVRQAETSERRSQRRLAAALAEEEEAVGTFERRAIGAFKYGSSSRGLGFVRGLAGAADLHEAAVAQVMLRHVLDEDRDLVAEAERARRGADLARAEAEDARADADRAREQAERAVAEAQPAVDEAERTEAIAVEVAEEAADELAIIEAARREQAQALAAVRADERAQRAVFRRIEQDAAARAALTAQLEERIERFRASPPPPVDGSWPSRLPAGGAEWAPAITEVSQRNGLDPRLFAALVWTESHFRPDVVSHAGAIGLAQLMPGTAESLGVDPWIPEENLDGGSRYLAMRIAQTGSVECGLAAYNAGIGNVQRHGCIPPFAETQNYVVTVLERYERLAG